MVTLTAPLNYLWQNWLERTFPGWKVVPRSGKRRGEGEDVEMADRDEEIRDGLLEGGLAGVEEEEVRVRNWGNIGKKWFTDCITFGALFNTTAFLVIMGFLKHKSSAQIGEYSTHQEIKRSRARSRSSCVVLRYGWHVCANIFVLGHDLRTEMWPIIYNGYKIWPFGNIISTTFVPVERRIVFLSTFGFFWNLYLSFVALRL